MHAHGFAIRPAAPGNTGLTESGSDNAPALWLPPERLRRYQWAKVAVAGLVVAIFVGWMVLQWSLPLMRLLAGVLIAVTVWVVARSMADDRRRARGRQIAVTPAPGCTPESTPGSMTVTQPTGETTVRFAEVKGAAWRDEPADQAGLWLFDAAGQTLVHLDEAFVADQAEARVFLGWLRRHSDQARFDVQWPPSV